MCTLRAHYGKITHFFSFVFHLFYSRQDHKYIYIYIYSCFTQNKTNRKKKKISLNTFFFYSFSSLSCYSQRCSSLNTVIYPIQNFKSLITNSISCAKKKKWNNFPKFHKTQYVHVKKLELLSRNFFFLFISGPLCPKFSN